jgi:hypothetical protein
MKYTYTQPVVTGKTTNASFSKVTQYNSEIGSHYIHKNGKFFDIIFRTLATCLC